MAATDSTEVTSPKVKAIDRWALPVSIIVGALAIFLGLLTPDLLDFLGPYAPLLSAVAVYVAARLAAWNARDPLRENYTAQETAMELQRQREQNPTAQVQATTLPPDDWATTQWPDNRG